MLIKIVYLFIIIFFCILYFSQLFFTDQCTGGYENQQINCVHDLLKQTRQQRADIVCAFVCGVCVHIYRCIGQIQIYFLFLHKSKESIFWCNTKQSKIFHKSQCIRNPEPNIFCFVFWSLLKFFSHKWNPNYFFSKNIHTPTHNIYCN